MTKTKDRNPHVEFASSHSPSPYSTLNAFSALYRCNGLLDDLDELEKLKVASQKHGIEFGVGWFGFEIISYYLVAFTTCLEWHARSRLVDVVTFKPECADSSDVKPISADALAQSIGAGVTVANLLGAMTQVTSFDKYCAIFGRVFEVIGTNIHPKELVSKLNDSEEGKIIVKAALEHSLFDMFNNLFVSRHHLVHEITLGTIGPHTLRNNLDIEFARAFGQAVRLLMVNIEKVITDSASDEFPNKLNDDGIPINEYEYLEQTILHAETVLTKRIRTEESKEVLDLWEASLRAYDKHKEAQDALLGAAQFASPRRFYNPSEEIKVESLRYRLAYLRKIEEDVPEILAKPDEDPGNSDAQ